METKNVGVVLPMDAYEEIKKLAGTAVGGRGKRGGVSDWIRNLVCRELNSPGLPTPDPTLPVTKRAGALRPSQIREIRRLVASGTLQKDVADLFGISASYVSRIVSSASKPGRGRTKNFSRGSR